MSKACWTLTKLPFFNPVCFSPKRSRIFVSVLLHVINLFSPLTEIQLSSKVPFGKWTVSGSIRFDNFLQRLIRFEFGRPFGWLLQQKLPDKFSCWAIFSNDERFFSFYSSVPREFLQICLISLKNVLSFRAIDLDTHSLGFSLSLSENKLVPLLVGWRD